MSKSFDGPSPPDLAAALQELENLPPELVEEALSALRDDELADAPVLGPIVWPAESDVLAGIAAAPLMARLSALAAQCSSGGVPLADADRLARELDTGDGDTAPFPNLDWLVGLAVAASFVAVEDDRLVVADGITDIEPQEIHRAALYHAIDVGLADLPAAGDPDADADEIEALHDALDQATPAVLAALLNAGAEGAPLAEVRSEVAEVTAERLDAAPLAAATDAWWTQAVDRLAGLGVVALDDELLTLTPAGTSTVATILRESGMEVLVQHP